MASIVLDLSFFYLHIYSFVLKKWIFSICAKNISIREIYTKCFARPKRLQPRNVSETQLSLDDFFFVMAIHFFNFAVHRAYKTLRKLFHPDYNAESVESTEKFQVLTNVHEFLMCAENRQMYDDTGKVRPDPAITVSDEDFENCKRSYQGNE